MRLWLKSRRHALALKIAPWLAPPVNTGTTTYHFHVSTNPVTTTPNGWSDEHR